MLLRSYVALNGEDAAKEQFEKYVVIFETIVVAFILGLLIFTVLDWKPVIIILAIFTDCAIVGNIIYYISETMNFHEKANDNCRR